MGGCCSAAQEEAAAVKRAEFEQAKKEAHQKVQEYKGIRAQASAAEETVRDKSRLIEQKQREIDEKKVCPPYWHAIRDTFFTMHSC